MLHHVALTLWAVAAWTVPSTALPTLHARTGHDLVNLFERAAAPQLNFTASHGSSILQPNDANFATVTHRWSGWEAPTFSVAFVPATEKDVSIGVRISSQTREKEGKGHGNMLTGFPHIAQIHDATQHHLHGLVRGPRQLHHAQKCSVRRRSEPGKYEQGNLRQGKENHHCWRWGSLPGHLAHGLRRQKRIA